ncbi:hypothetical protein EZJ43_16845 [Pedobacter changchengzhani]|uniref:Uncharacterized protein n=1 Tax=Pedobacter changchengzhani TaxID=2529274 RepID=A0A4R5MGZ3_9SPHI|nr:hypothetical protein [Pedobacter changchengzhani]TDG34787.1 hypothetical protein EZJ43_16845 [Pedobacter changchengzhani]
MQQVEAQTVGSTNVPDLNTGTPPCINCAPVGWVSGSTDMSNANGYPVSPGVFLPWTPALSNVPAGQQFFVTGLNVEKATTTISGLTAGTTYIFTFFAADLQTASTDVNRDLTLTLIHPDYNTLYRNIPFTGGAGVNNWEKFTYTFTATGPTLPIAFKWAGNYSGAWGVYVGPNAVTALPCSALTSAAGTATQTVNAGTTITNVTYSTTATGVSVAPAFPAGITGVLNTGTGVYTISGTPTAVQGLTSYAIQFTGASCATNTQTFNLTVNCKAGASAPAF